MYSASWLADEIWFNVLEHPILRVFISQFSLIRFTIWPFSQTSQKPETRWQDPAKGLPVAFRDQARGVSGSCEAFSFAGDPFCSPSDADISALFMLCSRHRSSRLAESHLKALSLYNKSINIHIVTPCWQIPQIAKAHDNAILQHHSVQEMIEIE